MHVTQHLYQVISFLRMRTRLFIYISNWSWAPFSFHSVLSLPMISWSITSSTIYMPMPPAQTSPHTCLCDIPTWVSQGPSHSTCLGKTHHNAPLPTQASSSFPFSANATCPPPRTPPPPPRNQPSNSASQNLGVFLGRLSHLSTSVSNPSPGLIDFTFSMVFKSHNSPSSLLPPPKSKLSLTLPTIFHLVT